MSTLEQLRMTMDRSTSDVIESDQPDIQGTFESRHHHDISRVGDDVYSFTRSTFLGRYEVWSVDGAVVTQRNDEQPVRFVANQTQDAVAGELEVFSNLIRSSEIEIIAESSSSALVELTCAEDTELSSSGPARLWCSESSSVLLTIRLEDSFLERAEVEGPLAFYPGLILKSQAVIEYSADVNLDQNAPFDTANAAPLECVAENINVDIDDHEGLASFVSTNTTEGNRELFVGCGFSVWPPGQDLHG